MHDTSDAELVARARAGDKRAFGELVERHQPMVLHVALRMFAHEEVARELAQEALLEAYLSLKRLRDATRFPQWLYGITLNVCRSHRRSQHTSVFSLDAMLGGVRPDERMLVDPAPSPHAMLEARELHERVLRAIEALPPSEREATLLFYYDQLT
ncbi:MAG: sigma-70 family RNA polymerase sigma factor, partial [Chloroflexi bacterium]|nr:sigma-70 family RNA polymerase sigma factor [Chloroflexota bacterium]